MGFGVQGKVIIRGIPRKGLIADDANLADKLKVGMVFQSGALFDSLTVGENVGFLLIEHTKMSVESIQVGFYCFCWVVCWVLVLYC